MFSVLLHDERLDGNTPDWYDTVSFTVEEDDPIDRVLAWVSGVHMRTGQIEDLSIMCHGYTVNHVGGHGLELSKDGVYQSNINNWSVIQGKVNWIFIYACNVAEVDPTVPANRGNGRQLCTRMAAITGATVIAPEKTQYYWKTLMNPDVRSGSLRKYKMKLGMYRQIDFGPWEGPVYAFSPDGNVRSLQW